MIPTTDQAMLESVVVAQQLTTEGEARVVVVARVSGAGIHVRMAGLAPEDGLRVSRVIAGVLSEVLAIKVDGGTMQYHAPGSRS